MRPTVSEQLAGTARILRDVVAPAVDGAYPSDILSGIIATLDALAAGWADVPAFLAWDAARTVELLGAVAAELGDDHHAALHALSEGTGGQGFDLGALETHHAKVRTLLAEVVASGPPAALMEPFASHVRERAARYPLTVALRMPGQR